MRVREKMRGTCNVMFNDAAVCNSVLGQWLITSAVYLSFISALAFLPAGSSLAQSETTDTPQILVQSTEPLQTDTALESAVTIKSETDETTELSEAVADSVEEEVVEAPEPPPVAQADSFAPGRVSIKQIDALIERDAIQLANRLLIENRSDYENSEKWIDWERRYFQTALTIEDWQGVIDRADQISRQVPYEFYSTLQMAAISAELQLKRSEDTRKRVRHLVFDLPYDRDQVIIWRELIAQTYLAEGLYEDARIALTAFNEDYRPDTPQWEKRYARVLFRTGYDEKAARRVKALLSTESRLLNLYAQFRTKALDPADVVNIGLKILPDLEKKPLLTAELWAIIELAARVLNDTEMQITAIENSLMVAVDGRSVRSATLVLPLASVQQLLAAYEKYALFVGNGFNFVIGDDLSWFQLAQEYEITSPITARALYAFLALKAVDARVRSDSVYALADILVREKYPRILELLLIQDAVFDIAETSPEVHSAMANRALRNRDYETALIIMDNMNGPPDDQDAQLWMLRHARIAIVANEFERGSNLLTRLIEEIPEPVEKASIDRIVQVVFDLQEIGKHDLSIELFALLYERVADTSLKRELLHWIADSYSIQENNLQAADLYLRSATLDGKWNDRWGKAARLKAADELVLAGLESDARKLYTELRDGTHDPRSKAVLNGRLEKLQAEN